MSLPRHRARAEAPPRYGRPCPPEDTVLHRAVREELETFLCRLLDGLLVMNRPRADWATLLRRSHHLDVLAARGPRSASLRAPGPRPRCQGAASARSPSSATKARPAASSLTSHDPTSRSRSLPHATRPSTSSPEPLPPYLGSAMTAPIAQLRPCAPGPVLAPPFSPLGDHPGHAAPALVPPPRPRA